jgi:H+-translocating NAD(P) transhydrogenase
MGSGGGGERETERHAVFFLRAFIHPPTPPSIHPFIHPPHHPTTTHHSINPAIPKESAPGERRVALTPAGVKALKDAGFGRILVQAGAGDGARAADSEFAAAGAAVAPDAAATLAGADLVVKVRPPSLAEVGLLKEGATLISYLHPATNAPLLDALASRRATALGLDCIPRTLSRAQAYDTLSSMANIAGHRAVIEAAHAYGRLIAGQITAAGKTPPASFLIIGGGVAGLAAATAARGLGAGVVRLFDTREAVAEQAKSVGATFVGGDEIMQGESGSGAGGYAKSASAALLDRERALFESLAPQTDIVITTALVPGQAAPVLLTEKALSSMRPGSVVVDLAAEAGGNCAATVTGEAITTPGGVTVVGYTDLPSRMAAQASTLFSNNVSKFILSAGPFTSGVKGFWNLDDDDAAVRGALVLRDGALTWPPPPLPPPPPKAPPKPSHAEVAAAAAATPEARRSAALRSAGAAAAGTAALVAAGAAAPGPTLAKALLATAAGYQTVWGVAPALHAPLMSVTNAISGTTAIGGLLLSGGGLLPSTPAQALAAASVAASAVNIAGGFTVSQRMLDMFKRPGDPADHAGLFAALPGGAIAAAVAAAHGAGLAPDALAGAHAAGFLGSAALCIAALASLSRQDTARIGNALGVGGVVGGLATTVGAMAAGGADAGTFVQAAAALGVGGAAGAALASRVSVTTLPNMVAAFHSLVGLSAAATSVAAFLTHPTEGGAHLAAAWAGTAVGAITATGSIAAYGKLAGWLSSKPLALPGRNAINVGLLAATLGAGALLPGAVAAGDVGTGLAALSATAATAGALGWHTTASIGGADVPVVITVLNAYSGIALAVEGALLSNDMCTSVGALIAASGSVLTYIMCAAMNRSIANVIFGGYASPSGGGAAKGAAAADGEFLVLMEVVLLQPPHLNTLTPSSLSPFQNSHHQQVRNRPSRTRRPSWTPCPPRATCSSCPGMAWPSRARSTRSPSCSKTSRTRARACGLASTPSRGGCRGSSTSCWRRRACRTML